MASAPHPYPTLVAAVEKAASDMLKVTHWGLSSFVSLPIFYPSGSPVTVKVTPSTMGFRVDDGGYAYRELEDAGYERSFAAAADKARELEGLTRDKRCLIADVSGDELERAISDVALASWNVADRVYGKIGEQEERDIEDYLRERLTAIFGSQTLDGRQSIAGSSTTPWDVSAIIRVNGHDAVFQAVSKHANSVYRTSTAFHDLAALPKPPSLIAVVKDKEAMGRKLVMLSQAGRVIESGQPNEAYMRAVQ